MLPPRIAYVTNASPYSGVGKASRTLLAFLRAAEDLRFHLLEIDAERAELRCEGKVIRRWPAWWRRIPKPFFWMEALRALPRENYQLWHLTNQTLASAPVGKPRVVTVFDLIELQAPQERGGYWLARWQLRHLARADALVTTSHYTAQQIRNFLSATHPRFLFVIPLAAEKHYTYLPRFRQTVAFAELQRYLRVAPEERFVLFVGSEHPRKNLSAVVAAVAWARRFEPRLKLLKIGAAGLRQGRKQFLAAVKQAGLEKAVIRLENVPEKALPLFYNLAEALLLPSWYEGFGLPALEAMQCGCPVIVSSRASLPEVVGEAGIIVPPYDVESMGRAIVRLLHNRRWAEWLRQRGIQRAKCFHWEKAAEAHLRLYRRLLSPKPTMTPSAEESIASASAPSCA